MQSKTKKPAFPGEVILSAEQAQPFLDQIPEKNPACTFCGASLKGQPIRGYTHDGGWPVEGYEKLLWLYIKCPKCKYDYAIWKLGVPRSFNPKEVKN